MRDHLKREYERTGYLAVAVDYFEDNCICTNCAVWDTKNQKDLVFQLLNEGYVEFEDGSIYTIHEDAE